MFRENDRLIILFEKFFWHSTIFANKKSNNLQKFFSSFSSFSSISFQISVRFHDCRIRYELYIFTNRSSKSHTRSIDEKRKNNELKTLKAIRHKLNEQKSMISMFVINQKISRQFQTRFTFIFMLISNSFFLSLLRYLQSELTTHEELNRVKNIFRNCCSILLNCNKITEYWKIDECK